MGDFVVGYIENLQLTKLRKHLIRQALQLVVPQVQLPQLPQGIKHTRWKLTKEVFLEAETSQGIEAQEALGRKFVELVSSQ